VVAVQVTREISKGQLVHFSFQQDDMAASQTDVQLLVAQVTGAAGNVVDGYTMPFAGDIVAISWKTSAAATAGVLSIGPTVNGTEQADLTQSVTTASSGSDTALRETIRFAAGDVIGAEITTTSVWDATTADLQVSVYAILALEGI
jgi:hypothetical protein